jgi:hypothetical protein
MTEIYKIENRKNNFKEINKLVLRGKIDKIFKLLARQTRKGSAVINY